MAALLQLARTVLARVAGGAGRRAVIGGGAGALGAEALTGGGTPGFLSSVFGGGGGAVDGPRRRRRRKALTDSDIRIALTIANAISKKAAENFILQRVRSS